jgi:predicted nucleic acid-binding protein
VLVRAYLPDEVEHERVQALLADPDVRRVSGTWTRIEVTGALVRAARAGRGDERTLLAALEADLAVDGPVTLVAPRQEQVEDRALPIVREHALRALDAWHLACAQLVLPALAEPGEATAFASRDEAQAAVAQALGLAPL